jgi:hypothetical protein
MFGAGFEPARTSTSSWRVYQIAPPERWCQRQDSNLRWVPEGGRGYGPLLSPLSHPGTGQIVKERGGGSGIRTRMCSRTCRLSGAVGYQLP